MLISNLLVRLAAIGLLIIAAGEVGQYAKDTLTSTADAYHQAVNP